MINLVGKTIKTVEITKINEEFDDEPYLDITFTDGTKVRVSADYGSYTGKSDGEYPRFISLKEIK